MPSRKVLLVGWDAADWKVIRPLLDAGKMPNVQRLIDNGATGDISTLHPPLSPMLWTSIATGKRPFKHGIHGFSEPTPDGRSVQPVTNLSRKSKAIWNILNQNDLRSIVIGWWPSHPAEPINGVMVSDHYHRAAGPLGKGWPLLANTIHPVELAQTLAELRMHPDLLTPSMVEPFIPLAKEIDQDNDKRLALFLRTLAGCMSIQAAACWLLDNQPWDFFAVYFDAIDHFCHGFMRYHPPRQPWIAERDFELYKGVVSAAYQLHDQMLGTLLAKAGAKYSSDPAVILMSDHGFHPDHLRPASIPDIPAGPAIEHRDFGILAVSGPDIKKQQILHGPSLLDIAPTILALYKLPVGEDMDGKVLSQAFLTTPKISFIPTWEDVPGHDGRHPPHTRLDPVAAHQALEQMIALGYIERPDQNREVAVENIIGELRYNLGESYQDDDRHIEAHQIFSQFHAADPDEQRVAVRLFVSCQALGLDREMRAIVEDLDVRRRNLFEEAKQKISELRQVAGVDSAAMPAQMKRWRNLARYQPVVTDYLKAQILIQEKRYAEALAALERINQTHRVQLQIADLCLRLRRPSQSQQLYQEVLANDPDNAYAHLGLCRVALQRKQFALAAQSALDALQRVYAEPNAHFLLGLALTGLKDYHRAADAFRAALSFNPNFPHAHVQLAALLEKHLDDHESARQHRFLARRMRSRKTPAPIQSPATEPATTPSVPVTANSTELPLIRDSLIIVTGLPRSGTSMLMQMLAAGGLPILSDESRQPDEDNPRGYLEFEPVKRLLKDSHFLLDARGKVVKIVAPLLSALSPDLPCRIILCERNLDEVLDSQDRMLLRRKQPVNTTPEHRRMLKNEYHRMLERVKASLATRPNTQLLVIEHAHAIANPFLTAEKVNQFLGSSLDVTKMAAAIDPKLHRNRSGQVGQTV